MDMNTVLRRLMMLGRKLRFSESMIEVADILDVLMERGADLEARVYNSDLTFPTNVTALDTRHRIIVINPPDSKIVTEELQTGQLISLATVGRGRPIHFQSKYMEPLLPDPEYGLQLEMPSFLGTKQPRGSFRIFLDELGQKVGIVLHDERDRLINGTVRNISRSGVSMRTVNDLPENLSGSAHKFGCQLQLDESEEINCNIEVRNVHKMTNGEEVAFVGGRMTDLSRRDANRLTDFIEYLQQQRLESLMSGA